MARYIGMYRRSQLIKVAGQAGNDEVLRIAAAQAGIIRCASGLHRQETDTQTGNEVCKICGVVIDDYADIEEE